MLIQSKVIPNDIVDLYRSSKYRVMTIVPLTKNPKMRVYTFTQGELNEFLHEYDENAEFIVSVEIISASA